MKNLNNAKARYTKNLITSACFRLLKSTSFTDVTITEICNEAGVSRAAFYRNFTDRESIISYSVRNLLEEKLSTLTRKDDMFLYNDTFVHVWADQQPLIRILYDNSLLYIITDETLKITSRAAQDHPDNATYQYLAIEMAFLVTSLLYGWAKNDFRESAQQLKELTDELFRIRSSRKIMM